MDAPRERPTRALHRLARIRRGPAAGPRRRRARVGLPNLHGAGRSARFTADRRPGPGADAIMAACCTSRDPRHASRQSVRRDRGRRHRHHERPRLRRRPTDRRPSRDVGAGACGARNTGTERESIGDGHAVGDAQPIRDPECLARPVPRGRARTGDRRHAAADWACNPPAHATPDACPHGGPDGEPNAIGLAIRNAKSHAVGKRPVTQREPVLGDFALPATPKSAVARPCGRERGLCGSQSRDGDTER
jgi:hypothetical protein